MKKPIISLFAVVTGAFLLGSCGGTAVSSSSQGTVSSAAASSAASSAVSSSSAVVSSSSSVAPTPKERLVAYLATLADCNATFTDSTIMKTEFYGKKARYTTYLGDYAGKDGYSDGGVLVNGTQGIFDFTIENGAVVLGAIETVNSELLIPDAYYTPADLAGTGDKWVAGIDDDTWTSTDAALGGSILSLDGYSGYSSTGTFASTLVFNGDDVELECDYTPKKGTATTAKGVLTAVGTTTNAVVTAYLASPSVLPNPSGWTPDQKTALDGFLGTAIPFPTGATYAMSFSSDKDTMDEVSGFTITDFASGDIVDSYKAQIEAAGWTYSADRSTPEADITNWGYAMYLYEKPLSDATATTGAMIYSLQVDFIPTSALDEGQRVYYPNGQMQIIVNTYQKPFIKDITADELNTYYAGIKDSSDKAILPTFTFGEEATKITLTDNTATINHLYGMDIMTNYSVVDITIADETKAVADVTAISTACTAAKLTDGGKTIAADHEVSFSVSSISFAFSAAINYDDAGVYTGKITLTVMY